MSVDLWRQILEIWGQFMLVMSSPDGQKLLDMIEYVVKDVMDGPDQTPDNSPFYRASSSGAQPASASRVLRTPEGKP